MCSWLITTFILPKTRTSESKTADQRIQVAGLSSAAAIDR